MTAAATGSVARLLMGALAPLADAFASPAAFGQLLRDLGHEGTVEAAALADFELTASIVDLVEQGEELVARLDSPGDGAVEVAQVVADLVAVTSDLLGLLGDLGDVDGGSLDASLDDPAIWTDFARELPGYLLVQHLESEVPLLYGLLRLTGAITEVDTNDSTRDVLDAGQLVAAVGDPIAALTSRFGWGADFDHDALVSDLALVLDAMGVGARTAPVRRQFADRFFAPDQLDGIDAARELTIELFNGMSGSTFVDAGLSLVPIPHVPGDAVSELFVTNVTAGATAAEIDLGNGWVLRLAAGLDETGAVGARLATVGVSFEELPVGGDARWSLEGAPVGGWSLLGGLIELGAVELALRLSSAGGDPEVAVTLAVQDGRVILSAGEGDSFLGALLGDSPMTIEMSPIIEWSSNTGLTLDGSVGLACDIPLALRLGPVTIDQLHLEVAVGAGDVSIAAAVIAGADLGPVACTVDGIGVGLELAAATDSSGALGPLDANFVFVPPSGIGVGVDLGVVSGGGYLDIDVEAGSYDGVIDLEVLGVGVCAVAIIDTKLPDVDGWSMFFALFLDLPSIQLGFGFTLEGVGGVAGINRAIDVDALGSAVRSGSLDTILFPPDPIADAPIIIEEFRSIFPPADGSYVFGPIVKIGWGTPPLIEAELGIIIQLPDPLVIVVLGSVSAVLPHKDLELVALNLDVAGVIDFEAGTLAIDASLHDSHVVGFALSGDMALRAEFGNAQAFLMSVGGFHPRFDPPGDFPDLRPVTFGITAGSVLRIDFMSYFALTSNSVQCGADFTLDADVMGFGVYGSCGFDALIQFSPFMVITSVDFEVSITAAGVDLMGVMLYASVEGPNRWHVIGTARFEVLGFGKDIRVDELIGSKESEPAVEAADVLIELIAALATDDAWRVIEANDSAVTLQEIDDPDAPMFATPDAVIEVRQTLVPLGIDIEQFGNAPVGEHSTFELTAVGLEQSGTLDDWFAPGQFFELGNDDKLEGPEFELMRSGIQFGGGAPIAGEDVGVDTGYKAYIIDPEFPEEETFLGKGEIHVLDGVPVTAHTQNGFTAVHTDTVATKSPTFIVVDDGGATVASTTTWSAAYAASAEHSDLHIERELVVHQ